MNQREFTALTKQFSLNAIDHIYLLKTKRKGKKEHILDLIVIQLETDEIIYFYSQLQPVRQIQIL